MPESDVSLDKWKDRIRAGEEFRKKYAYEVKWKRWERWIRGIFAKGDMPHNLINSFYKALVPRVSFKVPRIVARPVRPDTYWQAMIVEKVINGILRDINIKKQIKRMVGDDFWYTLGVGKVGFDSEFGFFPTQAEVDAGEFEETFKRDKNLLEYHADVKTGMPWFLRVKPKNLVFPWGLESVENAPWIADMIIRHIDDVKNDPKYSNTSDLEPNMKIDPKATGLTAAYVEEFVKLWEIRDLRSGTMRVLSMDHDKYLLEQDDILQTEGLPYCFLISNDDLDQVWGIPDAQLLEAKQLELNDTDTQIMKHRRIALVKFAYLMNAIDEEEIVKLTSEDVAAGVKIKQGQNVRDVLTEIKVSFPRELLELKEMIRKDMRELFGYARADLGDIEGKTHITKEEIVKSSRGSEIRISERGDMVADLLKEAVKKIVQIVFEFWKQPRFVEIIGPDLMRNWVEFTGEQLRGEYLFEIEPTEEVPLSPEERELKARERLQALIPLAQPQVNEEGQTVAPALIDAHELVRQYVEASGSSAERLFAKAPEKTGFQDFMGKAEGQGAMRKPGQ